ncbi:hypothetical protein [Acinetobacter baumannii]|uniref:hypothetical protein n=2 Tax=Acinetobacter baumannii TaxID=470 RepID=UPI0015D1CE92|nr:hypothetical protein [Acinetobacter baumannii]MBI1411573.1 hypothetical protein [Acinetobacter baumannii]MBI1432865.1 hypothetical protein [Acinetobacter baumannii]QLI41192.1 hypothetical protein HLG77_16705 [Acinetobacter baumannii]
MPQCNECGRSVEKIHKNYKSNKFCHSCYVRIFKKRECPSCGSSNRLYKYDHLAICQKCENNRPCIRCQRVDYPIGKITENGPVCKSCSVYFREFQTCERCGALSQKLSRIDRFEDNLKVCPRCATRDYRTCSSCRRYRSLEEDVSTGQMYCKKCLTAQSSPCLTCEQEVPAGRGNYCEICSWHQALERKVGKLVNNLEDVNLREHFKNYSKWLEQRVGPHKAVLYIAKHIKFFEETNELWTEQTPAYSDFLARLRSSGLRKYVLPIEWLTKIHNLKIDIQAKEFCSELDQLNKLKDICLETSSSAQILQEYCEVLMNRVNKGKTSIRSARLAMKPAAALMIKISKSRFKLPRLWHIKHYLTEHPGQAAALTGFIIFLNQNYDTNLDFSFTKNSSFLKTVRNKKLEKEIFKLIMIAESSFDLLLWTRLCLRFFHKLDVVNSKQIQLNMVNEVEDGLVVSFRNESFWIPKRSNFLDSRQVQT